MHRLIVVIPRQIFKKRLNDIGYPSCSATPRAIMLLGLPIGVKQPPMLAPRTSPHQTSFPTPSVIQRLIIGANVAVRGMLSITPDGRADSHMTAIDFSMYSPSIRSNILIDSISMRPTLSILFMTTKRPARKNTVDQSIPARARAGCV